MIRRVAPQESIPAGCSKWPDFSPAQPRRAETRRSAGKAAGGMLFLQRFTFHASTRTLLADFFSIQPGIADYQCRYPLMISSILFRINGMEARRMTGRQQLLVGTDDGQPQGLEFHRQRQMQDLW